MEFEKACVEVSVTAYLISGLLSHSKMEIFGLQSPAT